MTKYKIGDKVVITGVTDHRRNYNGKEVTIKSLNPNGTLSYKKGLSHYSVGEYCVFWDDELIPASQKIVITTDGAETLARLYEGNKVIGKAVAKCSPEDEFDFNIGAKLAFDRLTGNKPAEDEKLPEFEVGERYEYKDARISGIIEITKKEGNHYFWKAIKGMGDWSIYGFAKDSYFAKRLEKLKYYNGKVVCVEKNTGSVYTVGKVYEFKDGKVKIDNGATLPLESGITTLDEWNNDERYSCKFIPLVE